MHLNGIWVGAGIVAFGAFVLLILIPYGVENPDFIPARSVSPTFWPKAAAWMMVIFGLLAALEGAVTPPPDELTEETADGPGKTGREMLRNGFGFALLYVVWATIEWIGLPVAAGVLIVLFGWLFGERRLWLLGIIAVLTPAVLYYFFSDIANVPIPLGDFFE